MASSLEPESCPRCGHAVFRSSVGRPWQYYANGVLLLAAAVYFVAASPGDAIRWAIFVSALVLASGLSLWSLRTIRKKVLREMSTLGEKT
jgi:hypothetical protein